MAQFWKEQIYEHMEKAIKFIFFQGEPKGRCRNKSRCIKYNVI